MSPLRQLELDTNDARIAYDGAVDRLIRTKDGSHEQRVWRAAVSRSNKTLRRLEARLARARAEAAGGRWLQPV